MSILQKVEEIDGYQSLCKRDSMNHLARSRCSYTMWNDQSLAEKAMSFSFMDPNVEVVILHPSAEGGMPHTRGLSLICLPAYYPESRLADTIRHELVHISQRQIPSVWRTRARMDGWIYVEDSVIPANWLAKCRLNPDTAAARFFAWEGRHVPLPLFVREDKPDLRDTVLRWYDIHEGTVKSSVPASFYKKYGSMSASSMEHPYELWAYT
jgi:hypothetical protein